MDAAHDNGLLLLSAASITVLYIIDTRSASTDFSSISYVVRYLSEQ
jgi:hypothetical protein